MRQKYKEYIKLNRNVLLAFAASLVVSALAAQFLEMQQDYLNTTLTLLVDYAVFFTVFAACTMWITATSTGTNPAWSIKPRLGAI